MNYEGMRTDIEEEIVAVVLRAFRDDFLDGMMNIEQVQAYTRLANLYGFLIELNGSEALHEQECNKRMLRYFRQEIRERMPECF